MANTPGKQTAHPAQEDGADGSRNGGGAQGVRACAPTLAFVMIGKTALPVKAWKAEYAKLTAERETLNRRHLAAGTAGAAAPQGAGCGAVTGRAAG